MRDCLQRPASIIIIVFELSIRSRVAQSVGSVQYRYQLLRLLASSTYYYDNIADVFKFDGKYFDDTTYMRNKILSMPYAQGVIEDWT